MKKFRCQVEKVTPFNEAVYQVFLKPETGFSHKAGQYLSIIMDDKDKRPFSIASAPNSEIIELHIGAAVTESYPMQVIERLLNSSYIHIEAPTGNAWLRSESLRPRLLIAGGTGFSYIKSLIEHQIALAQNIETTLYWGCRDVDAMYYQTLAREWSDTYPWLKFVAVVEDANEDWQGKEGNLLEQIRQDFDSLAGYDVYIAGRFEMVGVAKELFKQMGVEENHLFGDAFAFIK